MKRILTTAIAGLFVIACGGDDAGDTGDMGGETPAPAPAPAPAAAPAAPPAAPPAASGGVPEGATAEMVAQGQTIFGGPGLCYSCHGPDGTGVAPLGPDLTDDVWLNTDGTYEGIIETVMTGVPEPEEAPAPMMPRGGSTISDEEVRAVAAYVWSLSNE